VFLKIQSRKLIVTRNHTDNLHLALILGCEPADTTGFLLAAASPTGTEFKKNRYACVILGMNLLAEYVRQGKIQALFGIATG
jgi:hypothetical protein